MREWLAARRRRKNDEWRLRHGYRIVQYKGQPMWDYIGNQHWLRERYVEWWKVEQSKNYSVLQDVENGSHRAGGTDHVMTHQVCMQNAEIR